MVQRAKEQHHESMSGDLPAMLNAAIASDFASATTINNDLNESVYVVEL